MRQKSEERRQNILDVAAEIFNEIGFDRASMAEISARLGGSKATLYNYFSSKEDIFLEVMRQQAGMRFESLYEVLLEDDDTRATLRKFGLQYLQLVFTPEIVAIKRLLYSNAERSKLGCLFYENGPKRGWKFISEFMERAMNKGSLRPADPMLAAIHYRSLIESEWVEARILGVLTSIPPAKLKASMERSLDAFYCIYGS